MDKEWILVLHPVFLASDFVHFEIFRGHSFGAECRLSLGLGGNVKKSFSAYWAWFAVPSLSYLGSDLEVPWFKSKVSPAFAQFA
jgi:hypothetical protein